MFRPSSIQAMFLVGPTYRGVFNGNLLQYQTYDMIDHAFLESNRMHGHSYEELTETASLPGNIALGSLEMFAPPQITSEKTVFVMHAANTTIECMSLNLIQMKLMIAASDPGGMLISIEIETHCTLSELRTVMMNLSGTASNALLIGDASPFFPNSVADAMRQAGGVAVALLLCSNATVRPNDTLTVYY